MSNVNFGSGISLPGGSPWMQVLAQFGGAVSAPANTNENTLVSYTLPGGTPGPNDTIEIWTQWTHTNSANNKTMRIRFGGTSVLGIVVTTTATSRFVTHIQAANSLVAQVTSPNSQLGTSALSVITTAINTAVDVPILITGQKASAGETITLENYSIRHIRSPS